MVCHAEATFLQSAQLGFRSGLDHPVHTHGDILVSGLENGARETAQQGNPGVFAAIAFEFRLELSLLLFQNDWLRSDRHPGLVGYDSRHAIQFLQNQANCGLCQYSLFVVGDFCDSAKCCLLYFKHFYCIEESRKIDIPLIALINRFSKSCKLFVTLGFI